MTLIFLTSLLFIHDLTFLWMCFCVQLCLFFRGLEDSACTFPTAMQNTAWHIHYVRDLASASLSAASVRTMTTTTNTVTGLTVTAHGTAVSSWACLLNENSNYVLKGDTLVDNAGDDSYVYFGFEYTYNVTYNGTTYCLLKPLCATESNAFQERVKVVIATTTVTTVSQISSNSVATNDYYVLMPSSKSIRDIIEIIQTLTSTSDNDDNNGGRITKTNYKLLFPVLSFVFYVLYK